MHNPHARLIALAIEIESQSEPIGADFTSGCWGARAYAMAESHGSEPCEFFGITRDTLEAKITQNARTPRLQRNAVMAAETRALAGAAG